MTDKELLIMQMYASQKKKKLIVLSVVLGLIAVAIGVFCYVFVSSQSFELAKTEVTIEYGTPYVPVIEEFVTFNDEVTNDNTEMSCDLKNIEGKDYAEVGEYSVFFTHNMTYKINGKALFHKKVKRTATVFVKDTVAPVFDENCPTEVNVMQVEDNDDKEDVAKYFTGSDLSGVCNISIQDDAVDYKTAGKYVTGVTATDKSGNKVTMECTVVVYAPELSINKNEIEVMVGKTANIKVTYKGKDKPKLISSDESIATVDENGKIKAVLAGKCFITVSANGMNEICNVTVTPLPVEQIPVTEPQTEPETTVKYYNETTSNGSGSGGSNGSTQKETTTKSSKPKKDNYPNKDFLFKDGYTMENVTEAATAYLKASGKAGSCIPLKNKEGIYIGMRVVFDE